MLLTPIVAPSTRKRIIEAHRTPDERYCLGRVEPELRPEAPRRWKGDTVEQVIRRMDDALGPIPEREYEVRDG